MQAWMDALEKPYGWVAVELNDPMSDAANRALLPALVTECERIGTIEPFIWMTRDFTATMARAAVVQSGVHGFIAEGEIPAQMLVNGSPVPNPQAQDWSDLAFHLADLGIDRAVATSYGPFNKYVREGTQWLLRPAPEFAKPLIDDGWYCLPYVYPSEHAGVTIAQQIDYAQHYPGWGSHSEPVLGTYGGYTLDSPAFNGRDACPGWSVWDAGEQF